MWVTGAPIKGLFRVSPCSSYIPNESQGIFMHISIILNCWEIIAWYIYDSKWGAFMLVCLIATQSIYIYVYMYIYTYVYMYIHIYICFKLNLNTTVPGVSNTSRFIPLPVTHWGRDTNHQYCSNGSDNGLACAEPLSRPLEAPITDAYMRHSASMS